MPMIFIYMYLSAYFVLFQDSLGQGGRREPLMVGISAPTVSLYIYISADVLLRYRYYRLVSLFVSFQGPPRGTPPKYQEGPKPSMAPPHILDKTRQVVVDTLAPTPNVRQCIYLCICVVGGDPPNNHVTLPMTLLKKLSFLTRNPPFSTILFIFLFLSDQFPLLTR